MLLHSIEDSERVRKCHGTLKGWNFATFIYDAVLMCWNALILAYIFRLRCQGECSDLDSFYKYATIF